MPGSLTVAEEEVTKALRTKSSREFKARVGKVGAVVRRGSVTRKGSPCTCGSVGTTDRDSSSNRDVWEDGDVDQRCRCRFESFPAIHPILIWHWRDAAYGLPGARWAVSQVQRAQSGCPKLVPPIRCATKSSIGGGFRQFDLRTVFQRRAVVMRTVPILRGPFRNAPRIAMDEGWH